MSLKRNYRYISDSRLRQVHLVDFALNFGKDRSTVFEYFHQRDFLESGIILFLEWAKEDSVSRFCAKYLTGIF